MKNMYALRHYEREGGRPGDVTREQVDAIRAKYDPLTADRKAYQAAKVRRQSFLALPCLQVSRCPASLSPAAPGAWWVTGGRWQVPAPFPVVLMRGQLGLANQGFTVHIQFVTPR